LQQQRKRAAATKAKGPHLLPSLLSWPKPTLAFALRAKGPRQKFISFQMFLFLAFASRRRPRGLQIRIKTNAKEAKVHFISDVLIFSLQIRIKTNAKEAKVHFISNANAKEAKVAFVFILFYLLACASWQRLQIRTKLSFASALLPWFCTLTLLLQPSKSKARLRPSHKRGKQMEAHKQINERGKSK
jgi:hypothetical protein